ncbi:DUF2848 domain-containing protein [Pararhodobacter sp.]|jgi:hypothetical protein|uniref:DUF2848 domain-containing protein n=1 Tax=Pararhodobacter sp. TaxID=2127056 RepID=UPI002FDD7A7F
MQIDLNLITKNGSGPLRVTIDSLVIAGWAGRDAEAMEHHIRELELLGVQRPSSTPVFYRNSALRLTTAPMIECVGEASSGEAEVVFIAQGGQLYVGLGSDHTDREVETYGITVSKQVCDKPVAKDIWPLAEVLPHWDSLILRSWLTADGARALYQEGAVSGLLAPDVLFDKFGTRQIADGTAMFGGTMPAIGGIRPGQKFECELEDPVLGRTIRFAYDIRALPIAG